MKTLGFATVILIFSIFIFIFTVNEIDPDLWGHLKYGQLIFDNHSIPKYDLFSYSSAGAPWTNHEWLSELLLYFIFKIAGSSGLVLFKYCSAILIIMLLYISVRASTKSIYLVLIFMTLAISILNGGFAIRPQIFTYVLFTCLILLLYNYESSSNPKWLYALPVIFLFWPNLHGGFIAGIGILICYIIFKIFKKKAKKTLILAGIFSLIAALANPYGIKLWLFVINAVLMRRNNITEWLSVKLSSEYLVYFALCFLAAAGFIFSKIKRSGFEMLMLFIALYFSFRHNRHISLFAILATIYAPKYVDSFLGDRLAQIEKRYPKRILVFVFLSLSFFFLLPVAGRRNNLLRIRVPENQYPVNAMRFMKENNIYGNIFSSFDWAQMCIWEFWPKSRVFFDGRYETVYNAKLIEEYFKVLYGKQDYRKLLSAFPETDIIFVKSDEPLAKSLSKDSDWTLVYSSAQAQIYLKNGVGIILKGKK